MNEKVKINLCKNEKQKTKKNNNNNTAADLGIF